MKQTADPDKHAKKQTEVTASRTAPPVHTRWKPGQSGNPKGRPKCLTLSEAYRRELAKIDESDPQKRTFAEVLAAQTIIKAKTGRCGGAQRVGRQNGREGTPDHHADIGSSHTDRAGD